MGNSEKRVKSSFLPDWSFGLSHYVLFLLHTGHFFLFCFLKKQTGFYFRILMKNKIGVWYVQVIGWSMWFSEYLFLERSWAKDENTLKVKACLNLLDASISRNIMLSVFYTHYMTINIAIFTCVLMHACFKQPLLILFKSCVTIFAGRSSTFKGLPTAILVGFFCRRDSLHTSKVSSSSRICSLTRIAHT